MLKQLSVTFLCAVISFSAYSGQRTTCPDLMHGARPNGNWQVLSGDPYGKHAFNNGLLSQTSVMGTRSIVCKYTDDVSLGQTGQFQRGDRSLWEGINIGGSDFWNCVASLKACYFYEY